MGKAIEAESRLVVASSCRRGWWALLKGRGFLYAVMTMF